MMNTSVSKVASNSLKFHCNHGALVGPLGLFIQGLLAFLAFTCLIVKRFCEPRGERRPWRIWFFDTSKQALGATVIHFANVFLADMFKGDPCTWYLVSFFLDCTVGMFVIWVGIKFTQCIVKRTGSDTLRFGDYGKPAKCHAWMGQCALYLIIMLVEKILITILLQFKFWEEVRTFIMSPVRDPKFELVIVMFVVPLVVNVIMFWVVDNFLMLKKWRSKNCLKTILSDSSVKYTKNENHIKYRKAKSGEESESDVFLSVDEDAIEMRMRNNRESPENVRLL